MDRIVPLSADRHEIAVGVHDVFSRAHDPSGGAG
jgi:hypothetical protein